MYEFGSNLKNKLNFNDNGSGTIGGTAIQGFPLFHPYGAAGTGSMNGCTSGGTGVVIVEW